MVMKTGMGTLNKTEFEKLRKQGIIKKGLKWTTWKKNVGGK